MLSEKAVFRSAFTPAGWVEPKDKPPYAALLINTPPAVTAAPFWDSCFSAPITQAAAELYLDPLAPNWLEGAHFSQENTLHQGAPLLLKCDSMHPRNSTTAPFADEILDLYAQLAPLTQQSRSIGLSLLQHRNSALARAQCDLELAQAFYAENLRIAAGRLKNQAILQLAAQLFDMVRSFPAHNEYEQPPHTGTRFFSAITANGTILCKKALRSRADTIIHLEDSYGAASRMLLYRLLCSAKQTGEPVCIGRCPLFWPDKIDHLIFPVRRVLFTVRNRHHSLKSSGSIIHCGSLLMAPLSTEQTLRIKYNCSRGTKQLDAVRNNLRDVWRIQAALADLCPLSLPPARFSTPARISITTKNTPEI